MSLLSIGKAIGFLLVAGALFSYFHSVWADDGFYIRRIKENIASEKYQLKSCSEKYKPILLRTIKKAERNAFILRSMRYGLIVLYIILIGSFACQLFF